MAVSGWERCLRGRGRVAAMLFAAWLCALACPGLGHAQDKRVVVGNFAGPQGGKLRGALVKSLKREGIEVLASKPVESAARDDGHDLATRSGRIEAARAQRIDAWVDGSVESSRREWLVTLTVTDASVGESGHVAMVDAKNARGLAKRLEREGFEQVGEAIAGSSRPPELSPEPVAAADPEPEPEPEPIRDEPEEEEDSEELADEQDEPDDASGPSDLLALELMLGAGGFVRDLGYRENVSPLATYDIGVPPVGWLEARWYPAAHGSDGTLAHFGLRLRGQLAFGLSSASKDGGPEFGSSSSLFEAGLRAQLPLGGLALGADFSYGVHAYSIDEAEDDQGRVVDSGIPSVSYSYLRLHGDASLAIGDSLRLGLGVGFLPLLGTGEVEDWFPRAGGHAFEASFDFGYALSDLLGLVASVGMRRYVLTLEPNVDDVNAGLPLAGGLVDQYFFGELGLRLVLGGES